jgi:hypothetical protein
MTGSEDLVMAVKEIVCPAPMGMGISLAFLLLRTNGSLFNI